MTVFRGIFSTILCVGALTVCAADAHAGFDWTPPAKDIQNDPAMHGYKVTPSDAQNGPLTPEPGAPAPAAPVQDVQKQTLTSEDTAEKLPVPMQEAPAEASDTPVSITVDLSAETTEPQPAQVEVQPAQPVQPEAQEDQGPALEGFGSDIPMALALREVVPSHYAYAFKNWSDAGLTVSWNGGKPWRGVLSDMLAPHNLTYSVTDGSVFIYPAPEKAPEQKAAVDMFPAEATAEPQPIVATAEPEQSNEIPVIKASMNRNWKARPGSTLRDVIEKWGRSAGVDVEWQSPYDYPINNAFNHDGTFEEAVTTLLNQYSRETPRPRGRLYPNLPTGPSVLMIN